MHVSQIVYISNRPNILNDTLCQVKNLMAFIDNVVIISPGRIIDQYKNPGFSSFHVIEEEAYKLPESEDILTKHSFSNYHLRKSIINSDIIDDVFIMSDDDYRPISPIELSFFVNNEKYNSYYFYDLKYWRQSEHSYDHCLINSFIALKSAELKTHAFSSHMPQIIDKNIYVESNNFFDEITKKYALCEWSTYFNYAMNRYPEKFNKPKIYQTMCWPQVPGLWPIYVSPNSYAFENYYEENYSEKTSVFYGLNSTPSKSQLMNSNFEKLRRLRLIHLRHSFPPPVADWAKQSFGRKIKNKILKTFFNIDKERFMYDRGMFLEMQANLNSND